MAKMGEEGGVLHANHDHTAPHRDSGAAVVAHSQGGAFAFRAAERCPGKVAAIVAIEAAQGGLTGGAPLAGVPVLAVYGDHIGRDARWPAIRARTEAYFAAARQADALVDVLDLPAEGIAGNSHMLMMENNNADIALLIQQWLQRRGLSTPAA